MTTPAAERAYRASVYAAAGAVVRVGRPCASLDRLLRSHQARTGVFVTAWNPMSRRMPDGWNRRMQTALGQRLRRYPALPATGGFRRWHEAHWLVLAAPPVGRRLARLFRQRAVVELRVRQPARLVFVRGD